MKRFVRRGRLQIFALVFFAAIAAAFLFQTSMLRRGTSVTFDETFYLNCSMQSIQDGWIDKRLSESGVGSIPIQIWGLPVALAFPRENRPDEWTGQLNDPLINAWSRWVNATFVGLPLVLVVVLVLWNRNGFLAAAAGGVMMGFSPTIVTHCSYATTEASFALFGLIGVGALIHYARKPSRLRFCLLGGAIGLAIAAKYSNVFLLPTAALVIAYQNWRASIGSASKRVAVGCWYGMSRSILLLSLALLVTWGTDWFSFVGPLKYVSLADTPPDSPWIKILGDGPRARAIMDAAHERWQRPSIVAALIARYLHQRDGHPTYLMGERSRLGWTYYFPLAWLFKSTPAEVMLGFVTIVLGCVVVGCRLLAMKSAIHNSRVESKNLKSLSNSTESLENSPDLRLGGHDKLLAPGIWAASLIVFWILVLQSHVNTGQRYLLIIYPLTCLLAFDLLSTVLNRRRMWLFAITASLGLSQVWSACGIAPHFNAYFSSWCGGPENGRFLLADSNIDWGQDLPTLKVVLDDLKAQKPLLSYFGTSNPRAYGIEAGGFRDLTLTDELDYDYFAISVSHWDGVFMPGDALSEFRQLEPIAHAAYSILIFDVRSGEAKEVLRRAIAKYIEAPKPFATSRRSSDPIVDDVAGDTGESSIETLVSHG